MCCEGFLDPRIALAGTAPPARAFSCAVETRRSAATTSRRPIESPIVEPMGLFISSMTATRNRLLAQKPARRKSNTLLECDGRISVS